MNRLKKVLFVDDDNQLIEGLAARARSFGLAPLTAQNALTALDLIENEQPDLICLDVDMPTANGLSLGEMVSGLNKNLPIIVLTGYSDDATRIRIANMGGHFVAKGSDTWPRLQQLFGELLEHESESSNSNDESSNEITELVFEMLGASDSFLDEEKEYLDDPHQVVSNGSSDPWVLCIEDDQDFSLALQLRLKQHGVSVVRAFEGLEGIKSAMSCPAEAILLDFNLPNGRGDYVLRRLKSNPVTRDIPVIVISGQKHTGLEKEMIHLGAAKFFAKPIRFEELIDELKKYIPLVV